MTKEQRKEMVKSCAISGDSYHCDQLLSEIEEVEEKLEIAIKLYSRAIKISHDEARENINDVYLNRREKQ